MARNYESAVLLTGDASGAVKAITLTDDHLRQLNARQQRNKKTTQEQNVSWESLSTTLKGAAAALGLSVAGLAALGTNQIRTVADTDRLAKSIGVQTGQLQAMQYAAQFAGLEQDKMGDILKDVADKIGDAVSNGGGEAIDVLNNLGLSAQRLAAMSPDEQLLAIADNLDRLGTRTQQINALEALGNDATRLLPLLENNAAELRRLMREGYDLNVAMSQSDIDSFVEAQSAIETMHSAVNGLTNSLLIDLAPTITDTVEDIRDWIDEAGGMAVVVDRISDAFGVAIDVAEVLFAVWLGRKARDVLKNNTDLFMRLGAAATSWTPNAIQQNIAYQAKLAEMAGLSRRTAIAQTALAGATRGVSLALGLVGGPAGAAILAIGAIYSYREELGLVPKPARSAAESLRDLQDRIEGVTKATIGSEIAGFTAELVRMQMQADRARSTLDSLEKTKSSPYSYGQGQQGDALAGINRQKSILNELDSEMEARRKALEQLRQTQLDFDKDDPENQSIADLGSWAKEYDKQHAALAKLRADREAISKAMAEDPAHAEQYLRMIGEIDDQIKKLTTTEKARATDAERDAKRLQESYQSLNDDLAKQIALFGETSDVARLRYDLEYGELKSLNEERKRGLIAQQQELENLKQRQHLVSQYAPQLDQLKKLASDADDIDSLGGGLGNIARRQLGKQIGEVGTSGAPTMGGLSDELAGPFGELDRMGEERDRYEAWYQERLAMLQEFENESYGVQAEATAAREALEREHQKRVQQTEEAMLSARLQGYGSLFGNVSDLTKTFAGEQSGIYKAMFAASKAFTIADSIIKIQNALATASASAPFPANLAAMSTVAAQTSAIISTIASTQLTGMAHDGIDNVPREGTWLLDGGERVLNPNQNRDITEFVARENRQAARNITTNNRRGGDINLSMNLSVQAQPGVSDADARRQGKAIGDQAEAQMRQFIIKEKRPGGLLAS